MATILSLGILTPGNTVADTKKQPHAGFEKLKKLAGDWTATFGEGQDAHKVKVTYRVTSRGATVMGTIMPGEEHEMVTMYHLGGDALVLTHYCAMGNQPRMRAEPGKNPNKLAFKFAGGTNLNPEKDRHMHEATFEFIDTDHFKSNWVHYSDGKPSGGVLFDMVRIKE